MSEEKNSSCGSSEPCAEEGRIHDLAEQIKLELQNIIALPSLDKASRQMFQKLLEEL